MIESDALLKLFVGLNAFMAGLFGYQTTQINQVKRDHTAYRAQTNAQIAVLEAHYFEIKEDLREIKDDVKTILRNGN